MGEIVFNFERRFGHGAVKRFMEDVQKVVDGKVSYDWLARCWHTKHRSQIHQTAWQMFECVVIPKPATVKALELMQNADDYYLKESTKDLEEMKTLRTKVYDIRTGRERVREIIPK